MSDPIYPEFSLEKHVFQGAALGPCYPGDLLPAQPIWKVEEAMPKKTTKAQLSRELQSARDDASEYRSKYMNIRHERDILQKEVESLNSKCELFAKQERELLEQVRVLRVLLDVAEPVPGAIDKTPPMPAVPYVPVHHPLHSAYDRYLDTRY
jgi:hypothetical protein